MAEETSEFKAWKKILRRIIKTLWLDKKKRNQEAVTALIWEALDFALHIHGLCLDGFNPTVEPMDAENPLHWTTLYMGLEHPQILVSTRVLERIPCRYQGTAI